MSEDTCATYGHTDAPACLICHRLNVARDIPGPYTLEDVADGVPGAAEALAQQATSTPVGRGEAPQRDPRQNVADVQPNLTAQEWDESLDAPEDPRIAAMKVILEPLVDGLSHREFMEVKAALYAAYDTGRAVRAAEPTSVKVEIPGLRPDQGPSGYWHARPVQVSNDNGTEFTVYRIEGDPNSVAVGRFKASLRKFLGVS